MSDNELDNLFKEAAGGFTPPQDESAWKQMASLLDQHAVKPTSFWNWKTISAVTVTGVISIIAIWFAMTDRQERISKTTVKNESNNATQGVVQEQKEQTQPTGNENLPPAKSLEDKSNPVHAVSKAESKSNRNSVGTAKSKPVRNDAGALAKANTQHLADSEKAKPIEVTSSMLPSQASVSEVNHNPLPIGITEDKQRVASDSIKPLVAETKTDSTENVPDVADAKKEDKKMKSSSVLSIKAAVSPDFSSVEFFSAGQTGINYGLLVGYSFNNRWSVYTGVISSKKLYETTDVNGSYNLDGHKYPMKKLDGDCRILDIPINVYYTFFPERSFSLRAGLGFSSYIMRKETYVFCVDKYGSNAYYAQRVNGKNNEWFKVMNISVAVSKQLTNRLSAEFEPFIKAPLAGVGEGKVSLVSMGAFVNLKYDLLILKK